MNDTPDEYNAGRSSRKITSTSPIRFIRGKGGVHYSAMELLVALLLFFVASPFLDNLPYGDLTGSVLLTLVMVSAVFAVGESGRSLNIALMLVIPAMIGKWVHHFHPDLVTFPLYLIGGTTFFLFIVGKLLGFILHAKKVNTKVLCAGLSGYLMLGLLWIPAYTFVAQLDPGAFVMNSTAEGDHSTMAGFNAFYFSFITLCTVGYGDISPVSNVARMLVVMQAITGLFYMTVVLARLVSLYSTPDH